MPKVWAWERIVHVGHKQEPKKREVLWPPRGKFVKRSVTKKKNRYQEGKSAVWQARGHKNKLECRGYQQCSQHGRNIQCSCRHAQARWLLHGHTRTQEHINVYSKIKALIFFWNPALPLKEAHWADHSRFPLALRQNCCRVASITCKYTVIIGIGETFKIFKLF